MADLPGLPATRAEQRNFRRTDGDGAQRRTTKRLGFMGTKPTRNLLPTIARKQMAKRGETAISPAPRLVGKEA